MTACRRALRILLGVVVSVAVVASGATASAAQEEDEGLRAEATTTYLFDAAAGVVHVTVEANLRNTVPDQRDGNVIRQTYFTGFPFVVPLGAANFAASGDGESLSVAGFPIEGSDTISRVEVSFGNDLFYDESLAVIINYDLTGEAPRSGGVSRINSAYASFEAYGVGDPGLSTVRVVIPSAFEVDSFGEDAAETMEGDNRVFTATGLDFGWYMLVSARNDDALVTTPGASADLSFEVRAWPGDEEWAQFVTDTVTAGVPVLSDLVGQPWPLDDTTLQVREAFTPYLYGYAGWFNALTGTIEVGEDLDQEVVLHELSHAWFNRDLFSDRWLNEGMAQTYAAAAITALGGTPDAPVAVDTEAPGATVLADWNTPSDDETAGPQEEFGYNASWFVVDSLVDEIGPDAMKQLFAAADAGNDRLRRR